MKKHIYDIVAIIGFVIWLGGSWYFGWNEEISSIGEKYTDTAGVILMMYGFLNSFVRGIKTEVIINNYEKEANHDQ